MGVPLGSLNEEWTIPIGLYVISSIGTSR
jgi:hypothetical protein